MIKKHQLNYFETVFHNNKSKCIKSIYYNSVVIFPKITKAKSLPRTTLIFLYYYFNFIQAP